MNKDKIGFVSFLSSEFMPGSSEEIYDGDIHSSSPDHKTQHSANPINMNKDSYCNPHSSHSPPISCCDHKSMSAEALNHSTVQPADDVIIRSRSRKDRRKRVLNFLRVPLALEYVCICVLNFFLNNLVKDL